MMAQRNQESRGRPIDTRFHFGGAAERAADEPGPSKVLPDAIGQLLQLYYRDLAQAPLPHTLRRLVDRLAAREAELR